MSCVIETDQVQSARIFSGIQELCSKIHEGVQQISGTLLQDPWKSFTYFPAIEVSKHCKVLPKNSYISKNFVATLKPWWLSALLQEDGREERASPRLWASSTSNTTCASTSTWRAPGLVHPVSARTTTSRSTSRRHQRHWRGGARGRGEGRGGEGMRKRRPLPCPRVRKNNKHCCSWTSAPCAAGVGWVVEWGAKHARVGRCYIGWHMTWTHIACYMASCYIACYMSPYVCSTVI